MTDAVIKMSANQRSFDNLTVVMISFKNLEDHLNEKPTSQHLFQIKEVESRSTTQIKDETKMGSPILESPSKM